MGTTNSQRGFALPTIVLASVLVLMALSVALSIISGTRSALSEQYYAQLSREAAEAGWAKAKTCIVMNGGVAQWSSASPLTPQSDCTGASTVTCTTTTTQCYVLINGNVHTSFSVGAATTGQYNKLTYQVQATVQLTRTSSPTTVWRTTNSTFNYSSSNTVAPFMSGGAGFDGSTGNATNDMGLYVSSDNQLYGYGVNAGGQLTDSKTPSPAMTPVKMALPAGVNKATSIKTSGYGATFLCIIGDDSNVWCRGGYTTSNDALGVETGTWTKMSLPSGLKATFISVSGYGADGVCALASNSTTPAQVYCAGYNGWGKLGNADSTMVDVRLAPASGTVPVFKLPAGLSAQTVETQSRNTCVIASDNNLYCAGISDQGQIAGTLLATNNGVVTPVKYQIPARGDGTARQVKSVIMQYHSTGDMIFVLTTDGVIWYSGNRAVSINSTACGGTTCTIDMSGTGQAAGNTGTGTAQVWGNASGSLTTNSTQTATGGQIAASTATGQCIDTPNSSGTYTYGQQLDIYACNSTDAQRWFWTADTGALWLPLSGSTTGSNGSNFCIDLANNTLPATLTTTGTYLRIATCNGSPAQQWVLQSDGTIRLAEDTRWCLDRPGGATANGTKVQLYGCTSGNTSQQWVWNSRQNPWKSMIAMPYTFCALRNDNYSGLWCSGDNQYGEFSNVSALGSHGSSCTSSSGAVNMNIPVSGVKVDPSKITNESKYQYNSLLIIGTDGQVYGAGRDMYGKLGNGATGDAANNYRSCSTTQYKLPSGVTAVDISTRDEYTTYVLGSDGNVYSSGANNVGQLGNGTTTNSTTPVKVLIPTRQFVY